MKYKTAFYILTVLWLLVALYHSSCENGEEIGVVDTFIFKNTL